jgi:anti-anti-sigma factor
MAIQITQELLGTTRIMALAGRLDTETAADVELALQDLLAAGERNYLFDLSGIGYVSSAGLRVLLSLAKKLDGGKGDLRLCSLNTSVRQVFDIAGFSKLFAIYPDRDAALGQAPKIKPEVELAQLAARLLGAGSLPPAPHAQAEAMARAAAAALGLPVMPAAAASMGAAAGMASPRAVPSPRPAHAIKPTGWLDKLKGYFGKR